ncbi:GspJ family T2SS minor pseudopilin variant LspJ [Legionella micdadei]|uniref:Type II secretion system protein J n=1 Tax=Legionella micdadei TaxID=451 RepID=A0A098GGE8_LEGMI|nr:GspJ family T2SS minor pseudopilin variant LspJ [Legionella micdadei]ARG97451.1 type II secretion system protein GspJ [Legionella micdadei]ARH00241.1 type II secretion system protein GspJ [Legionella micdadei]KTD28343.1 type II secretory pathway protein LspJ [Legionella micdadei]NSL16971.1 GspJ family T2SS minor pseudopilin variant LspJ [Legionella micdadei]CEG61067.1 Type II secretory pathway protein LspJ [Legionella micdadei]
MRNRGFTLIEILIALAVFAILAAMTSSALYYAFNTRARVNEQAEQLNALQLALTLIERDTEQVIHRDIHSGSDMHLYPAFVGEPQYLELSRSGIVNPNSEEKRSVLQRIAYFCRNNQFVRRSWISLDPVDRKGYQDKVLMDNLTHCRFAYLNANLQVLSEWQANALQQNQRAEPLPKAIRLDLTLRNWGNLSRLFIIPEGLYAEK